LPWRSTTGAASAITTQLIPEQFHGWSTDPEKLLRATRRVAFTVIPTEVLIFQGVPSNCHATATHPRGSSARFSDWLDSGQSSSRSQAVILVVIAIIGISQPPLNHHNDLFSNNLRHLENCVD
jgi:hypothetical protein